MEPPKKKEKNLNRILKKTLSVFFSPKTLIGAFKRKIAKKETFYFNGLILEYIYHPHNDDHRLKERSIEIPIICNYLKKVGIKNILEIGNVSNYYYTYFKDLIAPNTKTVVDLYEKGYGIINKDIKDYTSKDKFDFIYSISTFEHMDSCGGRDSYDIIFGSTIPLYTDPFLDSELQSHAGNNLIKVINDLLKPNGTFIITAPVNYAPEWDQILFELDILNKEFLNVKSVNVYYMKKINQIEWCQTDIDDAKKAKIHFPFDGVNVLSIVKIIK